ncbi:MATE family efflux transporter [Peptoniphilus stercorisuis]|uniref:Probable multidrug resistance protein NorM n=1 Tax=Peptoniphilus stercorisuis TaxID=1436965 RepID=A0ABS4KD07_9FIRM|nr:MATE family efflux transporter [Peptoniphilus stercorisuis]MBP2025658.1 putative MATE family efflux protein [Peptoniphilus stercorisuis]
MTKENKMGTTPIGKLLVEVSLPIMISMFIQALYNVVDSFFVSQLNEQAFTAVSLAFPIQNTMIGIAVGTGVGINALLSRSLGEKNLKQANLAAENGVLLAIIYTVVFFIFGIVGSEAFYRSQTQDPRIIAYGVEYISVVTMFSAGIFMQITMERLLQATGRSMLTMIMQIVGAVTNIIMDPILIFGLLGFPKMGVKGAAIATVMGQILAAILGMIFERKYNTEVHISGIKPHFETIKKIYVVGIPSIILTSLTGVTVYFFNKILSKFSDTALAAYGAYFKMQSFVFMPVFGLVNGMVPILAYNFGAAKPDRAKKAIKYSLIAGVSIMCIGFLIFQIFPNQLLKVFNASDELLEIGSKALRIISVSFLFAGISVVSASVFQALGNGVLSLMITFLRLILVLLPVAYLLSLKGDLSLVWWAYPIAEVVDAFACTFFLKKFAFKEIDSLKVRTN